VGIRLSVDDGPWRRLWQHWRVFCVFKWTTTPFNAPRCEWEPSCLLAEPNVKREFEQMVIESFGSARAARRTI
jgi:hypothetical protein